MLAALEHFALRQHDVLLGRQMREQVELLEHHAHMFAELVDVGARSRDFLPLDENMTARRFLEQVDATKHRRFARARRSEHDDDLAALDVNVYVAEHLGLAK